MANTKSQSEVVSEFDGLPDIRGEVPPENGKTTAVKTGAKKAQQTSLKANVKSNVTASSAQAPKTTQAKQVIDSHTAQPLNKRNTKMQGKELAKQV